MLESKVTSSRGSEAPIHDLRAFTLPPGFRGRNAVAVQLWWLVDALLFRPSPQVMYGWRRFILRLFGAHIGSKVRLRSSTRVTYPWKLSIGDFAWIGDDVVLYSLGEIRIGAHAVVSQKSYLCAGGHDPRSRTFAIFSAPILIDDFAWVAADVFIAPGVTIGHGAVVGARSSVFTNIAPMKIAYGSPAEVVADRVVDVA